MKIAFIGGGNMATALIGGLFTNCNTTATVQVADPEAEVKERIESQWPVTCFSKASQAIHAMDTIVLAVKPQILPVVLEEIGTIITHDQLVISIVAGATVKQIEKQISASVGVIRTMPNTPALIGLGITGMYASENCSQSQHELAETLMQAAGEIVWLEQEDLLNVVTAVSGSGPAYFFCLIEAMRNAGTSLGLPIDVATRLALHTAYGASTMALQSELDVVELRHRVTSKGGTTQAALQKLADGGFDQLVNTAITAATIRARELAIEGEQP